MMNAFTSLPYQENPSLSNFSFILLFTVKTSSSLREDTGVVATSRGCAAAPRSPFCPCTACFPGPLLRAGTADLASARASAGGDASQCLIMHDPCHHRQTQRGRSGEHYEREPPAEASRRCRRRDLRYERRGTAIFTPAILCREGFVTCWCC